MSTTFTTKINRIRTTTVGNKSDVVKEVDWTMIGTQDGQTFELPQSTRLSDPDDQSFIALSQLTEAQVIAWIEATDTRIDAIKAHIQYVLDRDAATAALTPTALPWAPPEESANEPTV